MRVGLINYTFWPSIENQLPSLVAALKNAGHTVEVTDLVFMKKKEALSIAVEHIKRFEPEVIGISAGYDSHRMPELVAAIRESCGDVPLLLGGFLPSHILASRGEEYQQSLGGNLWTISGPGEISAVRFLDSLQHGRPPSKRTLISHHADANSLPIPDFRPFEMERYLRIYRGELPVRASVGCPYRCSFCEPHPGHYSCKRADRLMEEILIQEERHRRDGMRSLCFFDEIFGLHKKTFQETMALFRQEGIAERLPWSCQTRAEVLTREWAEEAARSGCRIVQLGLECHDEDTRRRLLNKTFTNRQFSQAVRNLREAGVQAEISVMTNLPGMAFTADLQTLRWALTFKPTKMCIFLYHPVPGTPLGTASSSGQNPSSDKKGLLLNLLLKAYTVPYFIRRGIDEHGLTYIRTMFNYIFNIGNERGLPLVHRLTPYFLYHFPVHSLCFQRNKKKRLHGGNPQ